MGVLILLLTLPALAHEQPWSDRFPEVAMRVSHLDQRLASPDAAVRSRVLTELTNFRSRDSRVYPPFLRALLEDPSPEVRGQALKLLSEHHVFLGHDELPDSFHVHFVGDFRWRDPAEVKRVRDTAERLDRPEGGWAMFALGLVGDHEAIPLARAQLESRNVFVRHSAAVALVQLGQREEGMEALRLITTAECDGSCHYRYRAAEDLVRFGEWEAIHVLVGRYAFAPREILEDLTGRYFPTPDAARAWVDKGHMPDLQERGRYEEESALLPACVGASERSKAAPFLVGNDSFPIIEGDVRDLQRACDEFLARYDKEEVRRDYPEAIKALSSDSREEQLRGIRELGATRKLYVLPWLVPLIDAWDIEVRVNAGSSIEQIVSSVLLERRDRSQPGIVIRPPRTDEVDLLPLSWLALRMIRSPDLAGYGATMAAYLGRRDFEGDLRLLLRSHPAAQNSASHALVVLGVEQQQLNGLPPCPALERTAESGWVFLTGPSDGIVLSAPPSFYSFDLHDGAVWKSGDAVLEFSHRWRSLYSFASHEKACRTMLDGLPTIYIESQSAAGVELTAWFVTPDHFGSVLSARSARPEDLTMLRSIIGAIKKPVPKPNPLREVKTVAVGEDNAEAVRSAFSAYRSAILSGEGDKAAALLTKSTHDYYDEMRRLALYGDAEDVQRQSLVNQMFVLLLRLSVPPEQLESLPSQALIAHAVDHGWIRKDSVLKLHCGQVLLEGDAAVLNVIVDGKVAGPEFRFYRESGAWRLDLLDTMPASNAALQLRRQGVPENEFMLILMASALGHRVGPEAWIPLRNCGASIDFATFTGPRRVVSIPEQRSLCEYDFGEGCTTSVFGELTDAALHELFQHVMRIDDMPVLSIEGTNDEVQVTTGLSSRYTPRGGRGKGYTFKRCSGGWKLIRTSNWNS